MIQADHISKTFYTTDGRRIDAVKDAHFHIDEGEFVSLVGPSGCGKTTLLRIMSGLLLSDSGSVIVDNDNGTKELHRIGYLSQADSLLPWRNVVENVELGLEIQGLSKKERKKIAIDFIHRMGLKGFERSFPFELSGGMKKRVSLMRTLAYNPSIIFMDEPFSALDIHTRDMLEDELLRIWEETRKTILFVTHDLYEAISLADRVLLMTARPATVKSEYVINLPRPRTTEIRLTQTFTEILRDIWADLREEVQKVKEIPYENTQ